MRTQSQIEDFLIKEKYWSDSSGGRYAFRLSPDEFILTHSELSQINDICKLSYQTISSFDALIDKLSTDTSFLNCKQISPIRKALVKNHNGIPFMNNRGGSVPLLKVDIMQSQDGGYKIAEIDSYNPRGFAYDSLLNRLGVFTSYESENRLNKVSTDALVQKIKEKIPNNKNVEIWYILTEKESFYGTVLRLLAEILRCAGIEMNIVKEQDLYVKDGNVECRKGEKTLSEYIFMLPEFMHRNTEVRDMLVELIENNQVKTIYPPKPYLGSKLILSLLGYSKPNWQNLLSEFLPPSIKDGLLAYLPYSAPVGRANRNTIKALLNENSKMVLKANVSSGMKGVWFQGDTDFETNLARAFTLKQFDYMIQCEVRQKLHQVRYYKNETLVTDNHYGRFTAYADENGLQGLDITTTKEKQVHGGTGCCQFTAHIY